MFGFLNVYKPQGKTSHDVVAILRRITKIKQIGHTGTLDPFAEGVLPICIGKSTRLIEYLNDEKAYIGTIQLGISTKTYDIEGEVTNTSDKKATIEEIQNKLSLFSGEINQFPPIYSAIKVNGKKLYEYARNGEEIEIQPRTVNIYKLEIVDFDYEKQILNLYIECSKGTYIRSIAHDLGKELGSFGHLSRLIRTKAGNFLAENSISLESLNSIETIQKHLIQPIEYLDYPKFEISTEDKEKMSHGNSINLNTKDGVCILTYSNQIIAVVQVLNNKAKALKVFI